MKDTRIRHEHHPITYSLAGLYLFFPPHFWIRTLFYLSSPGFSLRTKLPWDGDPWPSYLQLSPDSLSYQTMTFYKQLFSRQSLRVGWSMLWRTWLAVLGLKVAFSTPVAFWYTLQRPPATDPVALRAHFDKILDIGSLLALVALIPAFNWLGKSVLRKRNLPVPARFIGWSIFWRAVGLSLLVALAVGLVILLPSLFLGPSKPVGTLATLLYIISLFAGIMCSYGWATIRVSQKLSGEKDGFETGI